MANELDTLTGTITALGMVVSQLVKMQAQQQPDPRAWGDAFRDLCLDALREINRSVGAQTAADATLDAASAFVVEMFKSIA